VHVEAQIQFRAESPGWPQRILDPEIRYWFKIINTDLWKSGNITTGRGLAESVTRKIAELPDDAKHRDTVTQTKRRQIAELTGLQDRAFTYSDELVQQRGRLAEIKKELENLSSTKSATGNPEDSNDPERIFGDQTSEVSAASRAD